MWASKFCLCGVTARSSLLKVSRTLPRTFSSLQGLNSHFKAAGKPIQSLHLFIKNQVKNGHIRIKSTIALDQNSAQLQSAAIRRKQICFWLFTCCGMVFAAINLGGYTRLTESGLSMVTWRFNFEKMPQNDEEWATEFAKYQQFPEFKLLKKDITLEEFKKIFVVEYLHRFWGRVIGIVFFLPGVSFWLRGYFSPAMKKRFIFYGSLLLFQGLLGWYMVKSGLEDRFKDQSDIPRVSQYRLAAHLGLALTLYVGLLWSALDHCLPPKAIPELTNGIKRLLAMSASCKSLVFITALSGALVAGLDAGLIYNSFPKMGEHWVPSEIFDLSPLLKNFTENPTTVQFDHRILGISTVTVALATWLLSRREKLPNRVKAAANLLCIFALLQVSLGISTLVHNVPTSLALGHQSGSVFLLSAATWLFHELCRLRIVRK